MGKALSGLFGSDNSAELAAQSQRQALAQLAQQQSQVDQAAASTTAGSRKGRRLLTALGAPGAATFGG